MNNKKLYAIFGSAFVFAGILMVILIKYAFPAPEVVTLPETKSGYKTESVANFSVVVPEVLNKEIIGDEVVFSRTYDASYQSSCDFIGVGKETLKDGEIGLRFVEGNLPTAFDASMNRPLAYKDFMTDDGVLLPDMGEMVTIGGKEVAKIQMSVEWCGQTYYFVPKEKGYVIVRTPIATQDFSEQGMNYPKILELSGGILLSEEKMAQHVMELISSL